MLCWAGQRGCERQTNFFRLTLDMIGCDSLTSVLRIDCVVVVSNCLVSNYLVATQYVSGAPERDCVLGGLQDKQVTTVCYKHMTVGIQ